MVIEFVQKRITSILIIEQDKRVINVALAAYINE